MRSTEVTKSTPSARRAALANAAFTGLDVVEVLAEGQPGAGADGSLEDACFVKHVVNFDTARSACEGGTCAAASCDWSCGVTAVTASLARLDRRPKNTTPTTATPMAPPSC